MTSASATEALVDAAHRSGELPADVTFADIGMMLVRIARPLPGPMPPALKHDLARRHLAARQDSDNSDGTASDDTNPTSSTTALAPDPSTSTPSSAADPAESSAAAAVVVPDTELGRAALLAEELLADEGRLRAMREAMLEAARPDAAERIAEELIELAEAARR